MLNSIAFRLVQGSGASACAPVFRFKFHVWKLLYRPWDLNFRLQSCISVVEIEVQQEKYRNSWSLSCTVDYQLPSYAFYWWLMCVFLPNSRQDDGVVQRQGHREASDGAISSTSRRLTCFDLHKHIRRCVHRILKDTAGDCKNKRRCSWRKSCYRVGWWEANAAQRWSQ